MARSPVILRIFAMLVSVTAGALISWPLPAGADEVASAIRRYKSQEVSTGYYEEFEVLPKRNRPFVEVPGVQGGIIEYSPSAAKVRSRSHLADSHAGLDFYESKTCQSCHPGQAKDLHTQRANLTCRQCHGGEPIASIQHYNSPMNPIRKHAYVCAKCHEGANASFGGYIVHAPAPGSDMARKRFPLLYATYWFMTILLLGTLAFFIPHSFLTGLRELFARKKGAEHDVESTP